LSKISPNDWLVNFDCVCFEIMPELPCAHNNCQFCPSQNRTSWIQRGPPIWSTLGTAASLFYPRVWFPSRQPKLCWLLSALRRHTGWEAAPVVDSIVLVNAQGSASGHQKLFVALFPNLLLQSLVIHWKGEAYFCQLHDEPVQCCYVTY
jgi:hypothetical protein